MHTCNKIGKLFGSLPLRIPPNTISVYDVIIVHYFTMIMPSFPDNIIDCIIVLCFNAIRGGVDIV